MQQISCGEERHINGGPGLFLLTRCEDALPGLIGAYANKAQLIYLDPPFGTGDTFHIRLSGEKKAMNVPLFSDTLDPAAYLGWMRSVLAGCHQLLSDSGSLYLHIDYRMSAPLRLILDELFGASNFMNEIIWCYKSGGRSTKYFPRKHDTILFYRKSPRVYFDIRSVGKPRGPEKRNHMKRFLDEEGRVCFSIRSGGKTYTYREDSPVYPSDVWNDIEHLQQKDSERVGYATQKPEALLERIILASSRPGDLVMDLFSGSGTTASVASRLSRRFLVTDASPFALYTLRRRQLKGGENPTLFSENHELTLRYPASPDAVSIDAAPLSGDRVQLRNVSFQYDCPLEYLAFGHMHDGCFISETISFSPKFPITLKKNSVFHVVDQMGRQAFLEV